MEIDIFAICDFAQDMNGKLVIVGTFDTIFATKLPAVHPTCSIVARFRFNRNEVGRHSFSASFLDDNGKEFLPPVSGDINVQITSSMDEGRANIVMGIGMLKLSSYGKHYVNLSLDGEQIKSLPFTVEEPPKKA